MIKLIYAVYATDYLHPSDNLPHYGREIADQVGIGALMLLLNFSEEVYDGCRLNLLY